MKLIEDLADLSPNVAHVTTSVIRFGFSAPHQKIFFVTERDFVGAKAVNTEGARLAPRRGKRIDPLALKDGDYVEKDQAIAEVDSDKATLELPAEASGIITLKAEEGDAVAVGAVVCLIDTSAAKAPQPPKGEQAPKVEEKQI